MSSLSACLDSLCLYLQLVIEELCELWSLFQQKLEIRLQQRFTGGGFNSGEVGAVGWLCAFSFSFFVAGSCGQTGV